MATCERTTKVVKISLPSHGKWSVWEYRAVECRVDQAGYLNERGVKVLYRSGDLYRPETVSGRGVGPECKRRAERIAEEHRLAILLGV